MIAGEFVVQMKDSDLKFVTATIDRNAVWLYEHNCDGTILYEQADLLKPVLSSAGKRYADLARAYETIRPDWDQRELHITALSALADELEKTLGIIKQELALEALGRT